MAQGIKRRKVPTKMIMTYQTLPQDANPAGNVHGGVIMKLIDTATSIAAVRHARNNCVTASMDRMDFYEPVFVGDVVTIKVGVNFVSRSSMELGARVEAENLLTGQIRHSSSAYLTFVALDPEGHTAAVPPLKPVSGADKRRNADGAERQAVRRELLQKTREKKADGKK